LPERDRQLADRKDAIAEARDLVKEIEGECGRLLRSHRHALDSLTAQLLEHETVSGDVVDACLQPSSIQVAA
jgi:ATP-dependent Zn protease